MDPARAQDATRRAVATTMVALALVVLNACGSTSADDPPDAAPTPTVVTASIFRDRVSVVPRTFAPGPISLVVTNRTGSSQQVTIERTDDERSLRQQTAPISPHDSATLVAEVLPGLYTVTVDGRAIAPARLRVGPQARNA